MFFSNRIINIGGHTLLKMIIGVQFLRRGVVFAFGGYAARVNGPIVEFDRFKLKLFQLGDVVRSAGIIAQAKTSGTEILAAGRFEFDRQGLVAGIARVSSTIWKGLSNPAFKRPVSFAESSGLTANQYFPPSSPGCPFPIGHCLRQPHRRRGFGLCQRVCG